MDNPKRTTTFLFGYGVGDFGLNIYWNTLSLILVFWYADVVGLDPQDAGTIFAIGVLWDAISDPLVASLAERNKSRFGSYRPFILFGSFALGAAFVALFWVPPWQGTALYLHLVIVHILFRTSYTIVAVPYSAMMARITYSSQDRADLSGVRMGFAFLGLFAISLFWFPLTRYFGGGQEDSAAGSFTTALIGATIATLALIICFLSTKENSVLGAAKPSTSSFLQNLWTAITKNKALQVLLALIFINSASGVSSGITLAFYIEANGEIFANKEIIFTALAVLNLITVPIWVFIIRRLDQKTSWTLASIWLIFCGAHLALFGPWVVMGVPMQIVAMGLAGSAYSILIWAIIPDTVEYGQFTYDERAEGATFGAALFVQKVSQAIMGFLVGLILSRVGYDQAAEVQLPQVADKLGLFLGVVPSTLVFLSIFVMLALPMTRASHTEIVDTLSKKERTNR